MNIADSMESIKTTISTSKRRFGNLPVINNSVSLQVQNTTWNEQSEQAKLNSLGLNPKARMEADASPIITSTQKRSLRIGSLPPTRLLASTPVAKTRVHVNTPCQCVRKENVNE